MWKGVPISPGVAVAQAFRIDPVLVRRAPELLEAPALVSEVARFDSACAAVGRDLDALVERISSEVGEETAEIFRAHRLLIRDPAFIAKVKSHILGKSIDAASAVHETIAEYETLFSRIPDEYLRERMADIRDVANRLITQLSVEETTHELKQNRPVILVAEEILPSQAVMFEQFPIAGIATETGGATGHAAIIARSLGIPAVSGLRGILQEVKTGDTLVLDGRDGHLLINPGTEVEAAYRKIQREYVDLRDRLIENRDQEARTADGELIELLANVNVLADAAFARQVGTVGVGLYRTEYVFLSHPTAPNEDEQYEAYRQIIEASPHNRVVIRTLDLGGDKQVPYLGTYREANPFMGWRSIRMSTDHPDFFQTQLRAIFRAARHGEVKLLIPMISVIEEVHRIKQLIARTCDELVRAGIPHGESVPVGVMIEVPAAALCIDLLLEEVDFVSIGSNDLIQYVMAADRDNPKVAHLCEPFNPALLRLLGQVIAAGEQAGKPVTICGEMAGRPRCVLALLGMGLRHFSMSPAFAPTVKDMIRSVTLPAVRQVAEEALQLRTAAEVRDYLTDRVKELCPSAAMMDTF